MKSAIILTGPDCSGKSTLAQELRKETQFKIVNTPKQISYDLGKKNSYNQINDLYNNQSEGFILDRSYDGEFVYAPIFRNYRADYQMDIEDQFARKFDLLLVFVYCRFNDLINRWQSLNRDSDRYLDRVTLKQVLINYHTFLEDTLLPFVMINTSELNVQESASRVMEAFNRMKKMWNCRPCIQCPKVLRRPHLIRGNIFADLHIYGIAPGSYENYPNFDMNIASSMWDRGNLSPILKRHLKKYNLLLRTYYTNILKCPLPKNNNSLFYDNHCDYTDLEFNMFKPRLTLLLGSLTAGFFNVPVKDRIMSIGGTHHLWVHHPSWIARTGNDMYYDRMFQKVGEFLQ